MTAMVYLQGYIVMSAITLMIVTDTHIVKIVTNICWNMVNIFGQKKRGVNMTLRKFIFGEFDGAIRDNKRPNGSDSGLSVRTYNALHWLNYDKIASGSPIVARISSSFKRRISPPSI